MLREPAFYWVKWGGDWVVAYQANGKWWCTGDEREEDEECFDTIGPRITPPDTATDGTPHPAS